MAITLQRIEMLTRKATFWTKISLPFLKMWSGMADSMAHFALKFEAIYVHFTWTFPPKNSTTRKAIFLASQHFLRQHWVQNKACRLLYTSAQLCQNVVSLPACIIMMRERAHTRPHSLLDNVFAKLIKTPVTEWQKQFANTILVAKIWRLSNRNV